MTHHEFVSFVKAVDPRRLHFFGKKLLKGSELFGRRARVNPLTGFHDALIWVHPDFFNTFSIIGMMSLNPCKTPFLYQIGTDNGDPAACNEFIVNKLMCGWFNRNDIVVVDSATYHSLDDGFDLADLLWMDCLCKFFLSHIQHGFQP